MENSFWILNNESEDYSALDKSSDAEYLIVVANTSYSDGFLHVL